jgi:hypothetical protein
MHNPHKVEEETSDKLMAFDEKLQCDVRPLLYALS